MSSENTQGTLVIGNTDTETTVSPSTSSTTSSPTSPGQLQPLTQVLFAKMPPRPLLLPADQLYTAIKKQRGLGSPQGSPIKTNPTAGKGIEVIEIVDEENDLPSIIRNACPRSQYRRPAHQAPDLQILGIDADTSLEDREPEVSITFSDEDYANDYELPEILKQLSLAHEAQQKEDSTKRVEISEHETPSFSCAAGKSVELRDGTFMRIKSVAQNGLGHVFVRGYILVRQSSQAPAMPRTHNELVWVQPCEEGESNRQPGVLWSERPVSEVSKNRDIIFTNQRYPLISAKQITASSNIAQNYHFGPLFCRWKRIMYRNAKGKVISEAFSHLMFKDADGTPRKNNDGEKAFPRIADCRSRCMWRGGTTRLGGSQTITRCTYNVEDDRLESDEVQMYTYGDAFCGAGGASRGALDAGMSVLWGFDFNELAIRSYAANFARHGAECLHESVHDFLMKNNGGEERRVDVLHASPPCQTFSWAKTVLTPEQDEKNEAVLFSIGQLLEVVKPRVVTMEETDGLVSLHRAWFDALVHIFVHMGYSVTWKVLRCEEYGVPQSRKRLVIIAAGPGEKLPSFPGPTHGDRSPLKGRLVTIHDCIQEVELGDPDHNLDTVHEFDIPRLPFDAKTLAKTLTSHGGFGNYHPSGLRHYTLRELASLQTFPKEHGFNGAGGITATRLQIGNAVPPAFGKAVFGSVVQSLREDDEEMLRMSRAVLVLE
ncbi:hypothetical protein DV736_g168, partial [Chaetothyriales sp. CBS 134916]